jgi:glyoxylase-like metal-dependent hydrolase (beta-lactamase superfamily II)
LTVPIPFVPRIDGAPYAVPEQVSPLIQRVIARNPSKFTYHGTGTYIVGSRDVVVVDPGPRIDSHRDALWAALKGRKVRGIIVTHCHSDHSPLAEWLHAETSAPRFAIGPHKVHEGFVEEDDHDPGEEDEPGADLSRDHEEGNEEERETIDLAFVPDVAVVDGERFFTSGEFTLTAVATPGHTSNHLCVAMDADRSLFTGDHVMGWSTTVVSPPDGDMGAYFESMRKVIGRDDRVLWPTHGGPVTDPQPFLAAYLEHRVERERQIVAQIGAGNDTIPGIVKVLYAGVDKRLHRPARRSVWSHLRKLVAEGTVATADGGEPRLLGSYVLTNR